ncbi:MAG: ABC transporter ATP-binding protein [Candidatus Heimdallarchaeota archaeon]|nr:ABC transporter ATP-binding protein [Candidatus Heimdallarchaeota archaeon]
MSMEVIIQAEEIGKTYKRGRSEVVHALQNINLKLYEAEMILLYGPSGSGKSTLLNVLSGLDNPTTGSLKFMGEDITEWPQTKLTNLRRKHVGFVFQAWELIDSMTAVENVESPLYPEKIATNELRTDAITLLRRLELLDREYHYPKELSGGEQQRVAIARALIKKPKVIFADEPTGNLDSETGHLIMRLLKTVCRQGTTVIIATHDDSLREYADRVISLHDGKMSEGRL